MSRKSLHIQQPPLLKEALPTMYDLPSEEVGQPGMPDIFHLWQAQLLSETFIPPNREPSEIFTASDLNFYFNVFDSSQYKRPDWFAVVGLPKPKLRREMRLSYVIWQEEVPPLIVVELLSPSTHKEDLGKTLREVGAPPTKWEVYEQWLSVPYYVVFSRDTQSMRVFRLSDDRYQEVSDHQGKLWIEEAELGLGLWYGNYLHEERLWMRWYDREGNWIPTKDELTEQAQLRAEQAQLHAEQERSEKETAAQEAERLKAKLRELGIDPDRL